MLSAINKLRILNNQSVLVGFFIFLSLFNITITAPTKQNQESKSTIHKITKLDEGASPDKLAWQAWLLVRTNGNRNSEKTFDYTKFRRITPKSIFIAPSLQTCPEGYEADSKDRCIRNVQIDQDAYLKFLAERLNRLYANGGSEMLLPGVQSAVSSSSSSSSSVSNSGINGPLQLNIPLFDKSIDEKIPVVETVVVDDNNNDDDKKMNNKEEEEVEGEPENTTEDSTDYKIISEVELNNKTIVIDDNTKQDNINNKKKKINPISDRFIPVVEFIDETNSNISDIIDYNIPVLNYNHTEADIINDKLLNNKKNSTLKEENIEEDDKENVEDIETDLNDTSIEPTVVLLLTPTKLPISNITTDFIINQSNNNNNNTNQVVLKMNNLNNKTEPDEIISIILPEKVVTSTNPIKIFLNTTDESVTTESQNGDDNDDGDGITEKDLEYDEQDGLYPDDNFDELNTKNPEVESTESEDEILKHSETVSPLQFQSTLIPSNEEQDTTESKISSEASINQDLIRETTLLGVLNQTRDKNQIGENKNISHEEFKLTILNLNGDNDQNDEVSTIKVFEELPTTTESQFTEEENTESQTILSTKLPAPVTTTLINFNPTLNDKKITPDDNHFERSSLSLYPSKITFPTNDEKKEEESSEFDSSEVMAVSSSSNPVEVVFPKQQTTNDPENLESFESMKTINPNEKTLDNKPTQLNYHGKFDTFDLNQPEIKTINDQKFGSIKRPDVGNFVRFSGNERSPRPNNSGSQIRFPSEEVNSIHTLDNLKERYRSYSLHHSNYRQLPKTESGLTKQSFWLIPPVWRNNDQRSHYQRNNNQNSNINDNKSSSNNNKNNNSNNNNSRENHVPFSFWNKLPIIKDPSSFYHSTYPTIPDDIEGEEKKLRSSRRISFYKEFPSEDITEVFARSLPIEDLGDE